MNHSQSIKSEFHWFSLFTLPHNLLNWTLEQFFKNCTFGGIKISTAIASHAGGICYRYHSNSDKSWARVSWY